MEPNVLAQFFCKVKVTKQGHSSKKTGCDMLGHSNYHQMATIGYNKNSCSNIIFNRGDRGQIGTRGEVKQSSFDMKNSFKKYKSLMVYGKPVFLSWG